MKVVVYKMEKAGSAFSQSRGDGFSRSAIKGRRCPFRRMGSEDKNMERMSSSVAGHTSGVEGTEYGAQVDG